MKKEKIGTIRIIEIQLNQRKFDTDELSRGVGKHRVKKGRGSYRRKRKYKKDLTNLE